MRWRSPRPVTGSRSSRDETALRKVADTLPGDSLVVPADLTDAAAIDSAFARVEEAWGPVEILVVNAGASMSAPLVRTSDEDWQRMLDLNLTAPFRCLAGPCRRRQSPASGAIVVKDLGIDNETILAFTTDNGAENFTWPDGGQTPFAGAKGTVMEGGFRVPMLLRWPGHVPAGRIENGLVSGLDWFPTFVAAAGDPNIVDELRRGKYLGDRTYKVHLDGYNQSALIYGRGTSARKEIFYFAETTLGAIRIGDYKYRFIDQPNGWLGGTIKVDMPILVNLRLDPFERTGLPVNGSVGSLGYMNWFMYEFWRFVAVQQEVAEYAKSFAEYPPMQKGGSFNLEAVKAQIQHAMTGAHGQ